MAIDTSSQRIDSASPRAPPHTSASRTLSQSMAQALSVVESRLRSTLSTLDIPLPLRAAMEHGLFVGGKRVRPFLLLSSARLAREGRSECAQTSRLLEEAAAAIEAVHCYSLIHDDLPSMDDDELRRGAPSVHAAFGEAQAILAGDALLTLAFEILARADTPFEDRCLRLELIAILARASGGEGMAGGQSLDLAGGAASRSVEEIHGRKTAALLQAACVMGAVGAGAETKVRQALTRYGYKLGLAYQCLDDIKDAGDKPTARAQARAQALSRSAEEALQEFGDRARELRALPQFLLHRLCS